MASGVTVFRPVPQGGLRDVASSLVSTPPRWSSCKTSAPRVGNPGFDPCFSSETFPRFKSYQ